MTNPHYTPTANPANFSRGRSQTIRDEYGLIEAGFDSVETALGLLAPKASPTFTGTVTAAAGSSVDLDAATAVYVPTVASVADSSTKAASTAFVQSVLGAGGALLPVQTTHSGKFLYTNGTSASWEFVVSTLSRRAISSNDSAVSSDRASVLDLSGDAWTLTFAAPGTLAAGWWCFVSNNGTGDITLSHTSGNIDGLTSYVLYPGEARLVQCDGSTIRTTVIRPFAKTFTGSGTFTKPPGYKYFAGLLWGGGGGGGKSNSTNAGSGGGGGACVPFQIESSLFSTAETITIGTTANGASVAGNGTVGNNSTIGSILTSYGGGGGGGNGSVDYYGGGGGGALSVGLTGGGAVVGGGDPGGATNATAAAAGQGLGGSPSDRSSAFGGAGGASGPSATAAGSSLYGGAGGGAVSNVGALRAAGTSKFGGAGGAAGDSASGTDGTAPGGGGGGTRTGTAGGKGARGELRIWGLV